MCVGGLLGVRVLGGAVMSSLVTVAVRFLVTVYSSESVVDDDVTDAMDDAEKMVRSTLPKLNTALKDAGADDVIFEYVEAQEVESIEV